MFDTPLSDSPQEGLTLTVELPRELVDALVDRVVARLREQPERRFLSKAALAEHLGITERRVKTLREKGMPARRVGRDLYFDLAEVARFIDREGVAEHPPATEGVRT